MYQNNTTLKVEISVEEGNGIYDGLLGASVASILLY